MGDGDTYEGEVNSKNLPNGKGKMTYGSGKVYDGFFFIIPIRQYLFFQVSGKMAFVMVKERILCQKEMFEFLFFFFLNSDFFLYKDL
jgi:hypothetical protein